MPNQNIDPNHRDFQASVNTRPVTNDEVAYRDGYVRGKVAEQSEQDRRRALDARIYEENARLRADNGVSTGLILGLVLAAVAAVVGGLLYVYSDANTGGVATPEAVSPQPTNETTIIERTVERTQEVVPAPSEVTLPEVNVDVTPPPAAEQPAPAPEAAGQPEASGEGQPPEPATQPQ